MRARNEDLGPKNGQQQDDVELLPVLITRIKIRIRKERDHQAGRESSTGKEK